MRIVSTKLQELETVWQKTVAMLSGQQAIMLLCCALILDISSQ